jgi:hypothetical protein
MNICQGVKKHRVELARGTAGHGRHRRPPQATAGTGPISVDTADPILGTASPSARTRPRPTPARRQRGPVLGPRWGESGTAGPHPPHRQRRTTSGSRSDRSGTTGTRITLSADPPGRPRSAVSADPPRPAPARRQRGPTPGRPRPAVSVDPERNGTRLTVSADPHPARPQRGPAPAPPSARAETATAPAAGRGPGSPSGATPAAISPGIGAGTGSRR